MFYWSGLRDVGSMFTYLNLLVIKLVCKQLNNGGPIVLKL